MASSFTMVEGPGSGDRVRSEILGEVDIANNTKVIDKFKLYCRRISGANRGIVFPEKWPEMAGNGRSQGSTCELDAEE